MHEKAASSSRRPSLCPRTPAREARIGYEPRSKLRTVLSKEDPLNFEFSLLAISSTDEAGGPNLSSSSFGKLPHLDPEELARSTDGPFYLYYVHSLSNMNKTTATPTVLYKKTEL